MPNIYTPPRRPSPCWDFRMLDHGESAFYADWETPASRVYGAVHRARRNYGIMLKVRKAAVEGYDGVPGITNGMRVTRI